MAGPWLYVISERPGYTFEIGGKPIPVSIESYSKLVDNGKLGEDMPWHISQRWKDIERGDEVYIYTGDQDFGILGFATVARVIRAEHALDLNFDFGRCKALLHKPIRATTVRSWGLNLLRNVVDLAKVAKRLERLLPWRMQRESDDIRRVRREAGDDEPFSPDSLEDARKLGYGAIVQRMGQSAFRTKLLEAYGGRCAMVGCAVEEALEAAHIVPYRGPATDHVANGLLLRADIHTLFDLRLLAVNPAGYRIAVSKRLIDGEYGRLAGKSLRLPRDKACRPSTEAMKVAWREFRDREAER